MEPLSEKWIFDVPPDSAVVTTTYVTRERASILEVTHEFDKEEGIIWQFHCGNGDYRESMLQLVRLDEILDMDATLYELATLPLGFLAMRVAVDAPWQLSKIG